LFYDNANASFTWYLCLLEKDSKESNLKDSNLLVKVSVNNACIIIEIEKDSSSEKIDLSSNLLFMFQSVENSNGTGSKTVHLSIDDFQSTTSGDFHDAELTKRSSFIAPTSAEMRLFYSSVLGGKVISQDYSLQCNKIDICLSPENLNTISSIAKDLNSGACVKSEVTEVQKSNNFLSIFKYQKSGSGISTQIRFEVQSLSCVIGRPLWTNCPQPLFDIHINEVKLALTGCISALSGECSLSVSIGYFNTSISDWEHAVEPFFAVLAIEQMPNEFAVSLAVPDVINTNITGIMLSDFAKMEFDFFCANQTNQADAMKSEKYRADRSVSPLFNKRLSEIHNYVIINESGLDFVISSRVNDGSSNTNSISIINKSSTILDKEFLECQDDYPSNILFVLTLALSAESLAGKRESVIKLSTDIQGSSECSIHNLVPMGEKNNSKNRYEYEPVTGTLYCRLYFVFVIFLILLTITALLLLFVVSLYKTQNFACKIKDCDQMFVMYTTLKRGVICCRLNYGLQVMKPVQLTHSLSHPELSKYAVMIRDKKAYRQVIVRNHIVKMQVTGQDHIFKAMFLNGLIM